MTKEQRLYKGEIERWITEFSTGSFLTHSDLVAYKKFAIGKNSVSATNLVTLSSIFDKTARHFFEPEFFPSLVAEPDAPGASYAPPTGFANRDGLASFLVDALKAETIFGKAAESDIRHFVSMTIFTAHTLDSLGVDVVIGGPLGEERMRILRAKRAKGKSFMEAKLLLSEAELLDWSGEASLSSFPSIKTRRDWFACFGLNFFTSNLTNNRFTILGPFSRSTTTKEIENAIHPFIDPLVETHAFLNALPDEVKQLTSSTEQIDQASIPSRLISGIVSSLMTTHFAKPGFSNLFSQSELSQIKVEIVHRMGAGEAVRTGARAARQAAEVAATRETAEAAAEIAAQALLAEEEAEKAAKAEKAKAAAEEREAKANRKARAKARKETARESREAKARREFEDRLEAADRVRREKIERLEAERAPPRAPPRDRKSVV